MALLRCPSLARGWHDGRVPDLARLPITYNLRALSLAEGARAALSVAVIIAISEYLNWPSLREAALGALLTCLCDPGGSIRRRVPLLLGFAIIGALITGGFGLVRGYGPAVALPTGVLALFAASFSRIYGQAPQQLGGLLGTVMVLSLDQPRPLAQAAGLGGFFALGALWAILLTLVIWRIYPFRNVDAAVGGAYRSLADLAADLRRLQQGGTADDTTWATHSRTHRGAVRQAIEAARSAVMDTLRSRGAGSPRSMQSLIRVETADQTFGSLIALSELLEHGATSEPAIALRLLRRLRALLLVLAETATADPVDPHPRLRQAIDAMEAEAARIPASDPLHSIANRIVERLRIAYTMAVPANLAPGVDQQGRGLPMRERLLLPLRTNLTWRSPGLRHALRAAVTAAPALGFTMAWFTPYDHWLTITIFATMQPFFAVTYARALERIVGTALGGIIAAAVGWLCASPLAIAAAMFPLAVAAMAVRAVSFGLFMLALTPVVVLLVEAGAPATSEWQIALARAGFTIIGGLVAVAASFILWPSREPEQLPGQVQATIAAHGRYAEAELGHLLNEVPADAVEQARRDAGIASNSLEAAISRSLFGPGSGSQRDRLEAALVIDAALRRCAGRLSALHLDPRMRSSVPAAWLRAWREWIGGAMRSLAAGEPTLPPRPDAPEPNPTEADGLRRLARQFELIAGAMRRLAG